MTKKRKNKLTGEQRQAMIDYLIATLDPLEPNSVFKPEMGALGPVKRVYKVPEPTRVTEPTPIKPEVEVSSPKEPVKVAWRT